MQFGVHPSIYLSFYPGEDRSLWGRSLDWVNNYEDESRTADSHAFISKHIDEKAMFEHVKELKRNPKKYHLINYNCSTIVYNALLVGQEAYWTKNPHAQLFTWRDNFKAFLPSYWTNFANALRAYAVGRSIIWTPADVLRLANAIEYMEK